MLVVAFVVGTIVPALRTETAYANQIVNRSLTLETGSTDSNGDGINDGGSLAGGVVNHRFDFTLPSVGGPNLGSIKFEYCTTASGSPSAPGCTTPTGLVTTSAAYQDINGTVTGFTINNTTNGTPYLTRTAASVAADTTVSLRLTSVTNPTAENETFFVRISTYASVDTTGTPIDTGTVAASTATQIELEGVMPESLVFCAGETIGVNGGGIPDCSTATPGTVQFAQLFSPSDTATATSQMAASTNAGAGYVITVNGPTLTSGSNTIPAMTVAGGSVTGTGQFGMNLVENTGTPPGPIVGAAVNPASNGTNYKALAATGFDTDGTYMFDPAVSNIVAASNQGGAGATDSQIYTASYIVNVSGSQAPGTYTTTLTYVCTATF